MGAAAAAVAVAAAAAVEAAVAAAGHGHLRWRRRRRRHHHRVLAHGRWVLRHGAHLTTHPGPGCLCECCQHLGRRPPPKSMMSRGRRRVSLVCRLWSCRVRVPPRAGCSRPHRALFPTIHALARSLARSLLCPPTKCTKSVSAPTGALALVRHTVSLARRAPAHARPASAAVVLVLL